MAATTAATSSGDGALTAMLSQCLQNPDTVNSKLVHATAFAKWDEMTKVLETAPANSLQQEPATCLLVAIMALAPVAVVGKILSKGADVNVRLGDGQTALHYAANFAEDEEVVRLLLEKGANEELKNRYGRTPKDVAELVNNHVYLKALAAFKGQAPPVDELDNKTCSFCGKKSSTALAACSACKKAFYCDGSCQKSHWKQHKLDCKKATGKA